MDQSQSKQDEHNTGSRTGFCPDEWKSIMQFLTTRQVMRTCARVSKTLYRIVCEELDLDIECNTFGSWQSFMSADGQCKTRTKTINLNAAEYSYSDLMRSISSENQPAGDCGPSSRFRLLYNLEFLSIENMGKLSYTTSTIVSVDPEVRAAIRAPVGIGEFLQAAFVWCLSEMKKLTRLELVRCCLCDESMDGLSGMIHLTHLDLSINYITGEGIRALSPLTELIHLDLSDNEIHKDRGLDALSHLTNLTRLNLSRNHIVREHVLYLSELDELTDLDLSHNRIYDVTGFVGFKKLSRLSLASNRLRFIDHLYKLPLTYLNLNYNQVGKGFNLFNFSILTTLCVSCNSFTDAHMRYIQSISSLECLDMSRNYISPKGVEIIFSMPNLIRLSIDDQYPCMYSDIVSATPFSVESVEGCSSLREFSVSKWRINKEGVRLLSTIYRLTKVMLKSCDLKKEDAMQLSNLKQLVKLDISFNPITDDGVYYLCSMERLKSLNLSNCSITNESLKHIPQLAHLRTLDLSWNSIDDYGIVQLKGMSSLVNLELSHTRFGESGFLFDLLTGAKRVHTKYIYNEDEAQNDSRVSELANDQPHCFIL